MAFKIFRGGVLAILPDEHANDFATEDEARQYMAALTKSIVENAPQPFRERVAFVMSERPGAEWAYVER
jgi:hypothetical protein